MKNNRTITNDRIDSMLEMSNQRVAVPASKRSSGSVEGKYPVSFDGGKTIIFISDKNKESEIRERYELHASKLFREH